MNPTLVLVADPLPIFRAGVASVLRDEVDFAVSEAGDLAELAALAAESPPELALVDFALPPAGGAAAARLLTDAYGTRVVVWSCDPTGDGVLDAIAAGACGYLRKEVSPDGLVRSLRGARGGEAPIARDLASLPIEALRSLGARARARERAGVLTDREREVLALVAHGARNREIADALRISEFTVKRHVQNILGKLEVASRGAAASFYRLAYDGDEGGKAWVR